MEKWVFSPEALLAEYPITLTFAPLSGPYSNRGEALGIGEASSGVIVGMNPIARQAGWYIHWRHYSAIGGCRPVAAVFQKTNRSTTGQGQVIDATMRASCALRLVPVTVRVHLRTPGSILPGHRAIKCLAYLQGWRIYDRSKQADRCGVRLVARRVELGTDERYATHLARGHKSVELDELIS
jgi:formyl-CoA transferase